MGKKVLITGSTSFVGSHLADMLVAKSGYEVHGLKRARSIPTFMNPKVEYHVGDITDSTAINILVQQVQPDLVFHLAAQSFVPLSWEAPRMTSEANAQGSLNVLEALRWHKPDATLLVAGTSEEYGWVAPEEIPIREDNPLRPLSPYGASKVYMDMLSQVYAKSYGMKIIISRAFNHTGPRRGEEFLTSKIAKRCAEARLRITPPVIELGNLDSVRDFTDVRDTIQAYLRLSLIGEPGQVYNIGTGVGRSGQEVLETLMNVSGVSLAVQQNPKYMRPADVPVLIADASKLIRETEWEPKYEFEQTMGDLYIYWLNTLRGVAR